MIQKEMIKINGRDYTRTFSDANFKIKKKGTNEVYSEAIDVLNFEYEETDVTREDSKVPEDFDEVVE